MVSRVGKKVAGLSLFVGALFLMLVLSACEAEPELYEVGAEQIQNSGITTFGIESGRTAEGAPLLAETCDDISIANAVTVYEMELQADTDYQVHYRITTLSCNNNQISFEAKLYIFDEHNRLIANRATDEQRSALLDISPRESGTYYLAIVPKFKDQPGGYALSVAEVAP